MTKEPKYTNLISKCNIIGLASPANRPVPEYLVLELMRELFYKRKQKGYENLPDPHIESDFSDQENFYIEAFQGRQKTQGKVKGKYYCPAYPQLVRNSWLRKQDAVTVNGFLFKGPIAHYLKGSKNKESEIKNFSIELIKALLGDTQSNNEEKEIFSRGLTEPDDMFSMQDATEKLESKLLKFVESDDTQTITLDGEVDEFSKIAFKDFQVLIRLEPKIPRHQWIALLMAYLRITISVWLLSQAKSQKILLDWCTGALRGKITSQEEIEKHFRTHSRSHIKPSNNPIKGLDQEVVEYGRNRIKMSVLLYDLTHSDLKILTNDDLENKRLYITQSRNKTRFPIHDLIMKLFSNKDKYSEYCAKKYPDADDPIGSHLSRSCEKYPVFMKPLTVGQTKLMREFLQVLRKSEGYDHRASHLLEKMMVGRKHLFKIAPGHLLLQMIVLFSYMRITADKSLKKPLMLKDVEKHFLYYGVDYSVAPDGRAMLLDSLSGLGLLVSSPDAGAYVKVNSPYTKIKNMNNPYKKVRENK
jgi:hypothetical protein